MRTLQSLRTRKSVAAPLQRKLLAVTIAQALLGVVSPAHSAAITVDDAGDVAGANCTLRDAIASANTDLTVAGCAAGSGLDTISFDAAIVPGVITLGSELLISSPMTIQGPVADQLTISGGGSSRIFNIDDGSSAISLPVTLERLTLSGGISAGNGGAVYNRDNLVINASTLSGNSAGGGGGGLHNDGGSITLTNSTLSANSATSYAGGVFNSGGGTATLTNNTLSGNSTGVAGTGGGFHNATGPAVSLTNNIIANSLGGSDCSSGSTFSLNVNNLIEDASCSPTFSGDPLLGPLQDNGGPTFTHALVPASPAFDIGGTCPATDQRGELRDDGACDIGAFELQLPASSIIVVNTLLDIVSDDGVCALREALVAAKTSTPSGVMIGECEAGFREVTISFDPAILPGTLTLGGSEMLIDSALTIQGPGADQLTISADNMSRIFSVDDSDPGYGSAVILDGLTLSDGVVGNAVGGAVRNLEELTINACALSGNTAGLGGVGGLGGAIASYSGSYVNLTLTNSTLSGNSANRDGGGLMAFGDLSMTNSTVSGNSAGLIGGGLALGSGASVSLTNNTLFGNSAGLIGGGLASYANLNLANNIIANSIAGGDCNPLSTVTNLNNLTEDGSCTDNAVNLLSGDPLLGPLQDNGGTTLTHAVLPGSPVIDAGDQASCDSASVTIDQTGMPRPIDGDSDTSAVCDIGAFEFVDLFGPQATLDSAPMSPPPAPAAMIL